VLVAFAVFMASATLGQQPTPPSTDAWQAPDTPHGKVIFSRSTDDASAPPVPKSAPSGIISTVTDADRQAVTFTRYTLDARLRPAEQALAVRAQITVRNDGDHPLKQLPLQLSSSLNWEEIRVLPSASPARFSLTDIASDVDHTGLLHEAAVELSTPIAPAASLELDVIYSGTIVKDAKRLEQIDTPASAAQSSDWDQVASDFVGIRGFGNVVWYPVSSLPIRLGDGDRLFAEVGAIKQREQSASVAMTVTAEIIGATPNVAILNGTVVPLSVTVGDSDANIPAIVKAALPAGPLGFQTLSLFLAAREKHSANSINVYARSDDAASIESWLTAGSMVTPLLRTWLQSPNRDQPKGTLSILELASLDDAPFEERQTLFTGLLPSAADALTKTMSHALAHAYFRSPRPWLDEGVAQFMASVWTEQKLDRVTALAQLDDQRAALALAEPDLGANGAATMAQPGLISNPNFIFYRTKATYVLWMLRSMIGDTALQNALQLYDPALDTTDDYFEQLVERASVAQPANKELHQFFEDWVYNDRGLPDLTIAGVYPSQAGAPGTYLVAVDVANNGGAMADVPIIVTSTNTEVTERLFVPAHGHAVRRLLIQGEPTQVEVNDGTVPETTASDHVQQVHYTGAPKP
jgi:hypothetical protein